MGKTIKVALDTGFLGKADMVRGIGFHSKYLIEEFKKIKDFNFKLVDAKKEKLSNYDLVHYQKFNPFLLSLPLKKKIKSIITIHDLIPLIYPEKYPAGVKGKFIFFLQKMLVKKIDKIITISETSKKDICRFLKVDPERVKVIYLAADKKFKKLPDGSWKEKIKNKYSLPEKFILYVGDVNYNKNIINLAKASKIVGIPLVIIGKQAIKTDFDRSHIENRSFQEFLKIYEKDKDIKRLGFVENDDLVKIYNLASVYCQPSFYEGFGLPILEAFATGTPVVASKNNCHLEIGGNAIYLTNPKDPKDMAQKIAKVLENNELKEKLIKKGFLRVNKFGWKKTAKETLKVYKEVLAINN